MWTTYLELRCLLRNHVCNGTRVLLPRNGKRIEERGVHGVVQNWVKGIGSLVESGGAAIQTCVNQSKIDHWDLTRYPSQRPLLCKIHRLYRRTQARSRYWHVYTSVSANGGNEGSHTLQLAKSWWNCNNQTAWQHLPSIRSPSILYSCTKDWIQSPNPATTLGSSVLMSGRGTTVSPNQHCSSLVVLLQSIEQYGWYCD